jgi:N-acetylmuramoyl-L-alanine amidase
VVTPANRLVVIDPGHGGNNTGTRNVVTGRYEKDYTLDWARRLAPLLEQSGWRVA